MTVVVMVWTLVTLEIQCVKIIVKNMEFYSKLFFEMNKRWLGIFKKNLVEKNVFIKITKMQYKNAGYGCLSLPTELVRRKKFMGNRYSKSFTCVAMKTNRSKTFGCLITSEFINHIVL